MGKQECKPFVLRASPPTHAPPATRAVSKRHTGRTHQNLPGCAIPEREMPQGVRSRDFGTHSAPPSRDNCRNKLVGVSTHRPQRELREQTAHTDRRRDNCKTNSITRQRQLQNKQHHDRRENCGSNTSTSAEKTAEQTSHILSASQLEHTARTHVVGTAIRTMQAKNQHLVSIAAQTHDTHMLLAKRFEPCREQRKYNRATGRANRTCLVE